MVVRELAGLAVVRLLAALPARLPLHTAVRILCSVYRCWHGRLLV